MWTGWRAGVVALLLAVAACSSIPIGMGERQHGLDGLNDDLAGALLALDLPQALEPVAGGTVLSLDIISASAGERHIKAVLGTADPGDLAGLLQPPADGRSYYLFGLGTDDQQAVREARLGRERCRRDGAGDAGAEPEPLPNGQHRYAEDHGFGAGGAAGERAGRAVARASVIGHGACHGADQGCAGLRRAFGLGRFTVCRIQAGGLQLTPPSPLWGGNEGGGAARADPTVRSEGLTPPRPSPSTGRERRLLHLCAST